MFEQIVEIKDALTLFGAKVAACKQAAEPPPPRAIQRISKNVGSAVGEHEACTGMIGKC